VDICYLDPQGTLTFTARFVAQFGFGCSIGITQSTHGGKYDFNDILTA